MTSGIWRLTTATLLLVASGGALAQDGSLVIETAQGKVKGALQDGVAIWSGIPYAQAPVGQLRWRAPQPLASRPMTFDATRPADDCIQVSKSGAKGQEDCLNLNIYKPATASGNLPVLIYIHGGNNQIGTSTEFNPQYIATTLNALIVTVNYRLGALGFNPLKALNTGDKREDSGNYSLLDISSALDWVEHNADKFGGNTRNITVAGFSAGGRDVMAMLISPLFAKRFQKALVFSGGMTTADKGQAETIFAQRIASLVVKAGKQKTPQQAEQWLLQGGAEVKNWLQQVPAAELAMLFGDAGIRMAQFPHLYRDGAVIDQQGFNTRHYNAVPLLMFTGQNEFSFFALGDKHFAEAFKQGTLAQQSTLYNQYAFVNKYGGMLYSLFNVNQSAVKMYPHYPAPIYGAEFRFGTDEFVTGPRLATIGSFHGVFMPFWDAAKYADFTADALRLPGAKQLGEQFNGYIRHFLQTGTPDAPGQVTWKPWTPENAAVGESLLILDANKQKALVYMSNKPYDSQDVIDAISHDNRVPAGDKAQLVSQVLSGRWFSEALDAHFAQ